MDTRTSASMTPTVNASLHAAPPARRHRWRFASGMAGLLALLAGAAHAAAPTPTAPIVLTNGDFSDAANNGSIGGGVAGGSGTATIGSGPWAGTYSGALGTLLPPTLTIGGGNAQISGIIGVNVAGIVNNNGRFHQNTGVTWTAQRRYVLSADIDAGSVLAANVFSSGNLGIALATGTTPATRLASSTVTTPTLTLLSGTTYRVSITHTTTTAPSGSIHLQLYGEPTGLLTANLLGGATFDNVTLSTHLVTQVPDALSPGSPGPYVAVVGQAVTPALSVRVLDALGDPIPGLSVTFAAPSTGASATFAPNPATTDANGVATVTTTANTIAGTYTVTATVAGVATPLSFTLTNAAGPAASVGGVSGSGQGAVTGTPFTAPLGLQVLDAFANPVPGVTVSFNAPTTGASASLSPTSVVTGANGMATTNATANAIAGDYAIAVNIAGLGTVASFALTNMLDPSITPTSGGESTQNGAVGEMFSCALMVRITDDEGVPQPNLAVDFVAPASGASAILTDGVTSGSSIMVMTDVDGVAMVDATANGIQGRYTIDAQLRFSLAPPMQFQMRNLAANDPLYTSGFDGPCIPALGLLDVAD